VSKDTFPDLGSSGEGTIGEFLRGEASHRKAAGSKKTGLLFQGRRSEDRGRELKREKALPFGDRGIRGRRCLGKVAPRGRG